MQQRVPVVIMTGFLGSGKTTVLNHLLRDPRLADTAVIVNEFGEIGLDHLLVEQAIDQMVLLENGCVCCSVRGDLVDTLEDLMRRVREGSIPAFRHVMIETTGLADPAPIVHTLVNDAATAAHFALQGIVTTVDAVVGSETLATYDEARAQVAMADALLITKSDRPDADLPAVKAVVASLNREAPVTIVENGAADPAAILAVGTIPAVAIEPASQPHPHPAQTDHHEHEHGHDHLWNIRSVSIVIDEPVAWPVLSGWLEWLAALRGPDILRIKGLVAVEGFDGPVLIQGVQHVFHPPRVLPDWPGGDDRSRLIVIARNIPAEALRNSLTFYRHHQAGARHAPATARTD
ncbi:MAG: GTP-binding protein [Hyphomicrobiaceae bacterium]